MTSKMLTARLLCREAALAFGRVAAVIPRSQLAVCCQLGVQLSFQLPCLLIFDVQDSDLSRAHDRVKLPSLPIRCRCE